MNDFETPIQPEAQISTQVQPQQVPPQPTMNQEVVNVTATSGWTTFYAVILLISGILSTITIIGAIIGVPIIFIGMRFLKAAEYAKTYKNSSNPNDAVKSMNEFLNGFKIYGILFIVVMASYIVLIILVIALLTPVVFMNR